jgi:hypothetical protein
MQNQVILARTTGGCAAVFVNQIVVAEANSTVELDKMVETTGRQLSKALGVPLVECTVEAPGDGNWAWPDLYAVLPPVVEQMARAEPAGFVGYCWSERGELCFDLDPPEGGTPYFVLNMLHESRANAADLVRAQAVLDFEQWLNHRRDSDVSAVFHEIVAKVTGLINLSAVQAPDALPDSPLSAGEDPVHDAERFRRLIAGVEGITVTSDFYNSEPEDYFQSRITGEGLRALLDFTFDTRCFKRDEKGHFRRIEGSDLYQG